MGYLLRRIARTVPVMLVVVIGNFVLIHAAPGDPVHILAGDAATPEHIARVRAEFGLDRPLTTQLGAYLSKVAIGDLGVSFVLRQPVTILIRERAGATLMLVGTALGIASVIGVGVGLLAARRAGSFVDHVSRVVTIAGFSLPVFWLGHVFLLVFSLWLGWLPAQGMQSLREPLAGIPYVVDVLAHLLLPGITLALYNVALLSRLTRTAMVEIMQEDFIRTARAKGLPDRRIMLVHGFRNVLLPLVTVVGANLGTLLMGAVLTETVFGWPGLGRLMFEGLYGRDYPLLMGVFLVVSVSVVLANLLTDLVYAWLDPRIRLG